MTRPAENRDPSRGRGGRPLPFALILMFALGMSGCGLESVAYTNIPAPIFSYSGGSLLLQDQGGVSTSLTGHAYVFSGYQILYRIFDDPAAAASASAAISALASSGQAPDTIYGQLTNAANKLVLLNYSNIDPAESILPATLSDTYGVSFVISTGNWSIVKSSGIFPSSVVAYRDYTLSASNRSTSFTNPDIEIGDSDYAGTTNNPLKFYLVMCAVGVASIDIFNPYYSLPSVIQSGPLQIGN